jgi:hypothetical protein
MRDIQAVVAVVLDQVPTAVLAALAALMGPEVVAVVQVTAPLALSAA